MYFKEEGVRMAYYSYEELEKIGFKKLGKNVKISTKVTIYNPKEIEIGDYSRIDDFCILSGKISIGRNVHIAPFCLLDAGDKPVIIDDFAGLAYRVTVFTRSDDYQGYTLTNPTIPEKFRYKTKKGSVVIKKHSIVGACSVIFPDITLEEGTAIGSMTLVTKSTEPWSIYVGMPAKKVNERERDLLKQEEIYLMELNQSESSME